MSSTAEQPPGASPAARPIRYWVWTRALDMWNGWRDGLHGIPAGVPLGTPASDALVARGEHRIASEAALAAPVLSAGEAEVVSRRERYEHAVKRAATARITLAEVPPLTEAELTTRRIAEADLPESLVRQRRQREHDERTGQLRRRVDQFDAVAQQELAAFRSAEATLKGVRDAHAARVRQLEAHTRQRFATYWKQLVRRHPELAQLNRALTAASPGVPARIEFASLQPAELS